MKILVLGASGFIGREILHELSQRSDLSIMALENKSKVKKDFPNVHIIKKDLYNLTLSDLPYSPELIIHAARYRTGRLGRIGRRLMAGKGKKANKKLLDQIKRMANPPRLIYLSGSLMYGNRIGKKITEDCPLSPISFAREYIKAEEVFLREIEKGQMDILMLRVPWVIGKGSWFKWNYIDPIKRQGKVPQYGEGLNQMSFIDVRDLARSVDKLIPIKQRGVLNIFHPESLTQADFANRLNNILGKEINQIDMSSSGLTQAVKEAFQSNIQLGSNYPEIQSQLQKEMHSLEDTLRYFGDLDSY